MPVLKYCFSDYGLKDLSMAMDVSKSLHTPKQNIDLSSGSAPGSGKPPRARRILEKIRAGAGAAGLTAVFAEGASSSKLASVAIGDLGLTHAFQNFGWLADAAIALSSLMAFIIAAYVVDEKDEKN
jgi:hypothetical protein